MHGQFKATPTAYLLTLIAAGFHTVLIDSDFRPARQLLLTGLYLTDFLDICFNTIVGNHDAI